MTSLSASYCASRSSPACSIRVELETVGAGRPGAGAGDWEGGRHGLISPLPVEISPPPRREGREPTEGVRKGREERE
jgi:hypothetical protein